MRLSLALWKSDLGTLLLSMSREKTLKASRKMAKTNYPPGVVQLQVLGSGGRSANPALYLFTDQTRYLFNCGEGTQRLSHEHKTKLSKLEHIFITSNQWDKIGGLPGLSLTIQDIGSQVLSVHGPNGLVRCLGAKAGSSVGELYASTRRFVVLKDLEVKLYNGEEGGSFEDHVLKVDYVPLKLEKETELVELVDDPTTDYYDRSERPKDPSPENHFHRTASGTSLCYVVQLKKKEGGLLIDKCIEKGVPPGPLLGKLKAGFDVTLPNGVLVLASQVRTADCPGPIFIVLDCPSAAHIGALERSAELGALKEREVALIAHFTPRDILLLPQYKRFMESFHVSTKHLILNQLNDFPSGSEAVNRLQYKLNLLDVEVFPLLQGDLPPPLKERPPSLKDYKVPIVLAQTGLKVSLRPSVKFDDSSVLSLSPSQFVAEALENEELKDAVHKLSHGQPIRLPSIVFLGTGSSIPNKTRNVSSFLLSVSPEAAVLFDCGEGTLLQLKRFFGAKHKLNIKAVFISHLHADHHLGLISVLKELPGLTIIAPKQIEYWLRLYSRCFEELSYSVLPCDSLLRPAQCSPQLLHTLGLTQIQTCPVKHCPNAFAVSISLKQGHKITYSGDTMPCDSLVELGRGSSLLIHEATMEDELKQEAIIKMHSTVSQAIEMGERMGASFTILTHFSQRYAKLPMIDHSLSNVGIAFDNMAVGLDDLHRVQLSKVGGLFRMLFAEDLTEMEHRAKKRRLKRELGDQIQGGN